MDYYKLLISFFLGLIPFVVKIIVDFKFKKEELKNNYRVKLYDKQFLLFSDLNVLLINLNDCHFHSALSYDTEHAESAHESSSKYYVAYTNFIKENELFIPAHLLTLLNKYHKNSTFLLSPKLTIEEALPPGNPVFRNRTELYLFFQSNTLLYNETVGLLRILIGTDTISNEIFQNIKNPKDKYSYITKSYKFSLDE